MAVLLIRHRVRDFAAWQVVFTGDAAARRAYGARRERIYHDPADPEEVLVYLEWDDLDRADLFVRSYDLLEEMVQAGMADRPDVWIVQEVDWSAS